MLRSRLVRRLSGIIVLLVVGGLPGLAQERVDTVRASVPADTLFGAAAADTVAAFAFHQLPIRTPFLSPVGLLQRLPASFTYFMGERGWPHGWSRFGAAPRHGALVMNDLPFSNPVTDRPSYRLLPFALLRPFDAGAAYHGQLHSVRTTIRTFEAPEPLTELRYHAGDSKLQSIAAAHVQQWPLGLFAPTDSLQALFGYVGQSTNGIYPRSETRKRQVLGRLRYWRSTWSIRLQYLYNEHSQDIHAGVLRRGSYASLFEPVGARVSPQDASRFLTRHDLTARLRWRWHADQPPLTGRGFWMGHGMRYETTVDSRGWDVRRLGAQLRQTLHGSNHRVTIEVDAWRDRLSRGSALVGDRPLSEIERHVTIEDSVRWAALAAYVRGGWHGEGSRSYGSAAAGISRQFGGWTGRLEGSLSGYALSWVERYGFGEEISPVGSTAKSRHLLIRGALNGRLNAWHLGLEASLQRWQRPIVLLAGAEDALAFDQLSQPARWLAVSGSLNWRTRTRRGFRFAVTPTMFRLVSSTAADPHRRLAASLPEFSIDAQIGARYQLFQGDLDALVYLRGEAWTSMRSRAFDPATALFPLPPVDAARWGPAGTLDLQIEAGIRNSTVFFAYENLLGGLVHPGTIVVPTFPLPARFMRFGIFWPLFN